MYNKHWRTHERKAMFIIHRRKGVKNGNSKWKTF